MSNTLAQECGRLEALNRELLEACKLAQFELWILNGGRSSEIHKVVSNAITKAEKGE